MWPFRRKSQGYERQAEVIAGQLLGACVEATPTFLVGLLGKESVPEFDASPESMRSLAEAVSGEGYLASAFIKAKVVFVP